MSAPELNPLTCALCRASSPLTPNALPEWVDAIDLDTRGADSRDHLQAQQCHHCGYCSDRIDQGGLLEQALVRSERYQAQLAHPDYPAAAKRYLCIDLVAQANWNWQRACWACIHAAWVCDDHGLVDAARQCRLWALNRMGQARAAGQRVTSQPGSAVLLRLDLLRRSQRFEPAQRLLAREGAEPEGALLQRLLRYQHYLLSCADHRRHSLVDMERWEARGTPAREPAPGATAGLSPLFAALSCS